MMFRRFIGFSLMIWFLLSCKNQEAITPNLPLNYPLMKEDFEKGSKTTYATGNILLESGTWLLEDALLGTTDSDKKQGNQALRIRENGSVSMLFDWQGGVKQISITHAAYGTDENSQWKLQYSLDKGNSWLDLATRTSFSTVSVERFEVQIQEPVRFRFLKLTNAGRINIDDFSLNEPMPTNIHLLMGIPTDATPADDYLLKKPQFCLSYNQNRNVANWVSWNQNASYYGSVPRYTGNFLQDKSLPPGFYRVRHEDYTNSGYDRGHMVRSEERTATRADNDSTFLLTNILPQKHALNAGPWLDLEYYVEALCKQQNKELYIIAGGLFSTNPPTIGNQVAVPDACFKIIVVLNRGQGLSSVNATTRVIAVKMPNVESVSGRDWRDFRVSVDELEMLSGYDFLNQIPSSVQAVLESVVDNQREIFLPEEIVRQWYEQPTHQ